jgi:ankyrin repeat protein
MCTKRFGWVGVVLLVAVCSLEAADDGSSLANAIKRADSAAIRALLQRGVDVNIPEADGTTALHWAVHQDDLTTVDLLIRAGAKAGAANRYGVTPLALASENGNPPMIARLLQAGADPNTVLADGETVLMTAARTGNVDAVRVLLSHGANPNATESWRGQTALMWAASENNAAVVRALVDASAGLEARSKGGFTPLMFAVRAGHIQAADALLTAGANVNATLPDGTTALVLAVTNAHYELAARLLDKKADPNAAAQGWTALHQLAWTRRPNRGFANPGPVPTGTLDGLGLIKQLVAHGADINARQAKEPKDGYRNLLNRAGATPFLLAAKSADVELMRALLASGADPLLPTADHTTPLMAAAGVGIWAVGESPGTNEEALQAVKLALDVGGDVTAVNNYGQTALHGAAHRGANAIVQLLVDRGARLDAAVTKDGGGNLGWKKGWTPLIITQGVFYANSLKRYPETAALIRQLMKQRGLPVDAEGADNSVAPLATAPR